VYSTYSVDCGDSYSRATLHHNIIIIIVQYIGSRLIHIPCSRDKFNETEIMIIWNNNILIVIYIIMLFASYVHWQCFVLLSIIASRTYYAAVAPSEYKIIINKYNNTHLHILFIILKYYIGAPHVIRTVDWLYIFDIGYLV